MTDSVVFIKEPLLILIALVEPKTLRYSRYGKTFSNFVIITEGGTVPMKKRVFVLIMCIIFLLGGCSSQNHSMNPSNEAGNYPSEAIAGDEEKAYGSADYSEDYSDTQEESQAASSTEGDKREPEIGDTDNQKLVYTCDMTIETLEYQETMKSIKDSISKYNGITEKETQTDDDTYWYDEGRKRTGTMRSYLVIRIPAASYNAFLEELEGSGKIVSKDLSVDNITKHYTEVKTTIKSLQIQEKRLLDMMEKAKTVEDMITVESRLTEVQDQLAQYKNALSSMDTDVKYSTVNLTISEVVQYEEKQDTFSERLHSTLKRSGELFLDFFESALFTVILLAPTLLVIILVVIIIVMVIRKIRKNKKQRKIRKNTGAISRKSPETEAEPDDKEQ